MSKLERLERKIEIGNDRLSEFRRYVEGNSEDPNAQRTLALISEFSKEVKHNQYGPSRVCRSQGDHLAAARQRRFTHWFGRLRQFQEWLRSKCDDYQVVLILRWIAEFEHKLIEQWLEEGVETALLGDPPDNDFLCGFWSALLLVNEEALGLPLKSYPFAEVEELIKRDVRDKRRRRRDAA